MALRKVPDGLDPQGALAAPDPQQPLKWSAYPCELVTPMYGGGVRAGEVDERMPVRASAIRGQLRFWWRLLARHKYKLSAEDVHQQEIRLWGGLGDTPSASRVWLRVEPGNKPVLEAWAEFSKNDRGTWKTLPDAKEWAKGAEYALFPGQGKRPGNTDSKDPSTLIKPGLTWTLNVGFQWLKDDPEGEARLASEARVLEALRWWASFGGLGARTRRGLGAVHVTNLEPVTAAEALEAGCQLVTAGGGSADASQCWRTGVGKLRDFRQKPGFARNPVSTESRRPGRSHWPEPDALRRLTGTFVQQHAPVHPAGNVFPRAAFGLPIIFHFRDIGEPNFTLNPVGAERMASPLILRPAFLNGKWYAAALRLPGEHLDRLALEMPNRGQMPAGTWWKPELAHTVEPLARGKHGGDVLSAFLEYFAGK